MDDLFLRLTISAMFGLSAYLLVRYGHGWFLTQFRRQEQWLDTVLNHELLLDIKPKLAMGLAWGLVLVAGLFGLLIVASPISFLIGAAIGLGFPFLVLRHLQQKRTERLENQLVDGLTTLASGVRAGLNLVQSMELLVRNSQGPIQQEFAQLLREYQMGVELNQAMRNSADRIGRPNYRLVFTAIEMHRQRGGNMGESLDRIAESIREIQRLEGKLDALTSQGRAQARMMGIMPFALIGVLYLIDPEGVSMIFTEPAGRIILVIVLGLIVAGFVWIRRIMQVDI